jgi:predicted acyl esterase
MLCGFASKGNFMKQLCQLWLLLLTLAGSGFWTSSRADESSERVPGPKNQIDLVWGLKIPMRDGVKLNATLYKPH